VCATLDKPVAEKQASKLQKRIEELDIPNDISSSCNKYRVDQKDFVKYLVMLSIVVAIFLTI
jgi:hypothetical protein